MDTSVTAKRITVNVLIEEKGHRSVTLHDTKTFFGDQMKVAVLAGWLAELLVYDGLDRRHLKEENRARLRETAREEALDRFKDRGSNFTFEDGK